MEISSKINATAEEALQTLIPEHSKELYNKEYQKFKAWMDKMLQTSVSEPVILAYLKEKGDIYKSSTLWCLYSKLKLTLQIYDNVDIGSYNKVKAFMKRKNVGYEPKKAKVLSRDEILKFITEAPDDNFLALKVILAFGVAGACRSDELYKIRITDVEDTKKCLVVTIPHTKTYKKRVFTIIPEPNINGVELYRKYIALRPKKVLHPWLFLSMRNGKCTVQRIGINTFYGVPKTIAKYLKLERPEEYTGHSLRRSSATLLADSGADILTIKRHGAWRSDNVAAGYVEDSIEQKTRIAKKILIGENEASSSSMPVTEETRDQDNQEAGFILENIHHEETTKTLTVGAKIFNCTNCTFNFNN